MNSMKQEQRFKFSSQGQGSATFNVVEIRGEEAISELFWFEITLVSSDANVDFDEMLKNKATLTIISIDGSESIPYHGILSKFEQLSKKNNFVFYKAMLVPRLWSLSLYEANEVYIDEKSVPDTVATILQSSNLTHADFSLSLKNPSAYRKRTFICQYQETNLNFINRSLEYLGIYYFFEHDKSESGIEKLHITDFKESHPNGVVNLTYCNPEDLDSALQDTCVYNFASCQCPVPQSVTVQDFNYRNAALGDGLKATAAVNPNGVGTVMLYGGNLRTVQNAQLIANVRAEAFVAEMKTYTADATAVGIRSGQFVKVQDHYRNAYNAKYLVTRVKHSGTQAGALLGGEATAFAPEERGTTYKCSFEAIPAETQFRPQLITPVPRVAGVLSAIIDAEGSGQYAELNDYGLYKVQLVYDKSSKPPNKGSCYVRMATDYTGSHNGLHFPLIKGTEVLLAFNGGDPDQPVIIGAVPNSENYNVVNDGIQTNNRILTNGGNQIVMNDQSNRQMVSISTPGGSTSIVIGTFPIK